MLVKKRKILLCCFVGLLGTSASGFGQKPGSRQLRSKNHPSTNFPVAPFGNPNQPAPYGNPPPTAPYGNPPPTAPYGNPPPTAPYGNPPPTAPYGNPPPTAPNGAPFPAGPRPYAPGPSVPQSARPPIQPMPMPPRNQDPNGQPADVPPHLRQKDDFYGTKNWFGLAGGGFSYDTLSRTNPGEGECVGNCSRIIEEPRWALQLQGAVGWGPIKRNNISFTTHYRYTQNLRTNLEQLDRFGQWFKTFKVADFVFPTRDMLRSHELVSEIRYSLNSFQIGTHAMLDFERVGSSARFLGAPNEVSDSVRNIEQLVPWVQWRIPGAYVATLYSPMRTEINKEDPRNSFTTWSLRSSGRGIFFSAIQDNLFYLPQLASTASLTLNWTNKKAASIQNDSSRLGAKVVVDFPIAWNVRLQPAIKYEIENFIVQRIKINNTTDGSATLVKRSDTIFGAGGQAYFDLSKHWRFSFALNYESTTSTLNDFNSSKTSYIGGFSYSWPTTRPVLRRLDRFSDSLSAEDN